MLAEQVGHESVQAFLELGLQLHFGDILSQDGFEDEGGELSVAAVVVEVADGEVDIAAGKTLTYHRHHDFKDLQCHILILLNNRGRLQHRQNQLRPLLKNNESIHIPSVKSESPRGIIQQLIHKLERLYHDLVGFLGRLLAVCFEES